jgi:hypothetical protein
MLNINRPAKSGQLASIFFAFVAGFSAVAAAVGPAIA